MTEVLKRYIDASNAFRKATDYHEGAIALYDLLYDLQAKEERTKEEERILTDTYTLLEYHLSAYETFLRIADPTNYKEKSKLVVLEDKAKTHKNTFCIKDIRKLRGKRAQKSFEKEDFSLKKATKFGHQYKIQRDKILVFNKKLKGSRFELFINTQITFEECFLKIKEYLEWFATAKEVIINSFNNEFEGDEVFPKADDNWYDTLEVYRMRVEVGEKGIFTNVEAADIYTDHLLIIEFEEKEITHMWLDG